MDAQTKWLSSTNKSEKDQNTLFPTSNADQQNSKPKQPINKANIDWLGWNLWKQSGSSSTSTSSHASLLKEILASFKSQLEIELW